MAGEPPGGRLQQRVPRRGTPFSLRPPPGSAAATADWIRLETASWYMTAEAVVRVSDDEVSVGLFLRHDRPIAAMIWASVSPLHRRGVPVMLRQALTAREADAGR